MSFKLRLNTVAVAVSVCTLLETLCYTYLQEKGHFFYYSSSLLYLLAGLGVAIFPLLLSTKAEQTNRPTNRVPAYAFYVFLLGLLAYHISVLAPRYIEWKIDKQWADMLPTIQLACERLLHGQTIYGPAPEIKPDGIIPYLPMMWLPYIPAVIFGFDLRWTTVAFTFGALFVAALPIIKKDVKPLLLPILIATIGIFLFLNYLLVKDHNLFWALTEEGVVGGFYLLLGAALIYGNPYLIAVGITCCLLSRYALLPWIPVYLAYLFLTAERNYFYKVFFTLAGLVSVVFVLPSFIWHPAYFLALPANQTGGYTWFWDVFHVAEHQHHTVGLFKFFTAQQAHLMPILALLTSFIAPALLLYFANRFAPKNKFIAFASLKVALVFFYAFMAIPYKYLFFPPTLISYAIVFALVAQPVNSRATQV